MKRQKRRKRPRRFSTLELWTHDSPAAIPFLLGNLLITCLSFLALVMVGFRVPWLESQPWIAGVSVVALIAVSTLFVLAPFAHRYFRVDAAKIWSMQRVKLGRHIKEVPNEGFVAVRGLGPITLVRHRSGKRHVWPRWLRRDGRTFVFALEGDKLVLRPLTSA